MNDSKLELFGSRVRQFRIRQGLSQEKLAEKCDLHRTYIGGVERGERNISLLNMLRIAAALEVTITLLVQDLDTT